MEGKTSTRWFIPYCRWRWHKWQDSAVNPTHIALEQQCELCGEYRHRELNADLSAPKTWRKGPLKRAQDLRDTGHMESEGFKWWGSFRNGKIEA